MFARAETRPFANRFFPRLEGLEERCVPSRTNLPPALDFSINQLDQRTVVLSGMVKDEDPSGAIVNFSGAYAGATVPGPDGSFCLTIQADSTGQVFAVATDELEQQSNQCEASIGNLAPQIVDFSAALISGTTWRFTGRVLDEWAAGLTLYFGGLPSFAGKSAVVQADGTFSLCVELALGEEGLATARCEDWWGMSSNVAETWVTTV